LFVLNCNRQSAAGRDGTINELSDFPDCNANDIRQLDNARKARNLISHKGAAIGDLSAVSNDPVYRHLDILREQIRTLASGDNLVSRWVYEIGKKAAPKAIRRKYMGMVDKWIFHKLDKLRGA
jgi:hypothetical protein